MKTKLAAIAFLLLLLVGCTDENGARKALTDQGYTNIEFTGYDFWTCGDDYTFHTGFRAQSIAKKQVEGAVCSGWMKGYSIKTK